MRLAATLIAAASLLSAQTSAPKSAAPAAKAAAATPAPAPAKNFKEIGSASAPITIEVYSDYECPSCRALWIDTMPLVMKDYVTPGKVRIIHRDFPLPQHQYTRLATRYANAAGQIGRYELVFTQIFKTQPTWASNGQVDAAVAQVLPPGEIQNVRDLVKNDMHLDDTVTSDLQMGQNDRLTQTPTMEVVYKGNRQQIAGALPYSVLKSYLDQMLSK
jgi:protein-disulfide isomerase